MKRVTKRNLVLGSTWFLGCAALALAAAAVDLGTLGLKPGGGRVVESIKLQKSELKAPAGTKMWVGTLRGTLKAPGTISLSAKGFTAIYGVTLEGPKPQEKVEKVEAVAVRLGDEDWGVTASKTYGTARDVLLEVAVPVDASVQEIYFLYDTAGSKGRVVSRLEKKR